MALRVGYRIKGAHTHPTFSGCRIALRRFIPPCLSWGFGCERKCVVLFGRLHFSPSSLPFFSVFSGLASAGESEAKGAPSGLVGYLWGAHARCVCMQAEA